jgi:hypothetical protein
MATKRYYTPETGRADFLVYTKEALSRDDTHALSAELRNMAKRVLGPIGNNFSVRVQTMAHPDLQSVLYVSEAHVSLFKRAFGLTGVDDTETIFNAIIKRAQTEYDLLVRGAEHNPLSVLIDDDAAPR